MHFQKWVTVRIGFGEGFKTKILPNIKMFQKSLHFQTWMTVRIGFDKGFKMKILPNIKIFQKNLHFQKCVTVRIGFGEGFKMKILPNIKIFQKNLHFQKWVTTHHYSCVLVLWTTVLSLYFHNGQISAQRMLRCMLIVWFLRSWALTRQAFRMRVRLFVGIELPSFNRMWTLVKSVWHAD